MHCKHLLSQPKLNQQLSSTEFEVRLHSYPVIHHHHHKLSVVIVCPASRDLCVQLYSHRPVQALCTTNSNFILLKTPCKISNP